MAYDDSKFRLIGGYPGQQLFLYHSEDAIATVAAANYFDAAITDYNLSDGDIIIATDTNAPTVDILVVSVAGTVATVTNGS